MKLIFLVSILKNRHISSDMDCGFLKGKWYNPIKSALDYPRVEQGFWR
jgi:hypothetical protein